MGSFSIWHWLIVLVVVLILFGGKGKISQIMGDVGKGLNAFKKSVKDDKSSERRPVAEEPRPMESHRDETAGPLPERDPVAKS